MDLTTFSQEIAALGQQVAMLRASGVNPPDVRIPEAFAALEQSLEELRAAEDELRQQNAQLADSLDALDAARQLWHALFDLAPDGYLVTDQNGIIMEANQAAASLLNMAQRDLVGAPLVTFIPPGRRKDFLALLRELTRQGRRREWQTDLLAHDARRFPATVSVVALEQQHSAGVTQSSRAELAWLIRDFSEHEQMEHELRSARDELERRVQERTAQLSAANMALGGQQDQLQRSQAQSRALARRLVELQERERSYVADRLYNEAAQLLAALRLELASLERASGSGASNDGRLAETQETLDRVMREMLRLAASLRPAVLDRLGLEAALRQALDEFIEDRGVRRQFVVSEPDGIRVQAEVETSVYRIVEDGLRNIAQHARATYVGLTLSRSDGHLVVTLEDDGVGFDSIRAEHDGALGLVGARARAEAVGGQLAVESRPGAGTTMIVRVPIKNAG